MRRAAAAALALVLPALAAGCGDLPQPFRGNPGREARRLAAPPAYRLAVPPPGAALLTDSGGAAFAGALAEALEAAEVPAVATETPAPLDLRLDVSVERGGPARGRREVVVPTYALRDADGRALAESRGAPVPLAEWASADSATFRGVAQRDAPAVAALLARVDAARRSIPDPSVLAAGGPPRVRLVAVRGAPGDGNRTLAARMGEFLGGRGLVVQEEAQGAGFAVQGQVAMAAAPGGKQRVEIVWIVTRRDGEELGRAVQLNEVERGSLDGRWGDVAYAAAEEAAGAVRTILDNAGAFAAPPAAGATTTPGPQAAAAGTVAPAAAPAR